MLKAPSERWNILLQVMTKNNKVLERNTIQAPKVLVQIKFELNVNLIGNKFREPDSFQGGNIRNLQTRNSMLGLY